MAGTTQVRTWTVAVLAALVTGGGLAVAPAASAGGGGVPGAVPDALVDRLVRDVSRLRALQPVDLGVPAVSSRVVAVGESGVIIGVARDAADVSRAFRWTDGVVEVLPDGGLGSEPVAVNVYGQVAAYVSTEDGRGRSVRWDPDGSVVELAPDALWSLPADIDDRGRVALTVSLPDDPVRAAVWDDGVLTPIGGGAMSGVEQGGAMNARGQVAGVRVDAAGLAEAFVWDDGDLQVLPLEPGALQSTVTINERGDVLVRLNTPGGGRTYALWRGDRLLPLDAGRAPDLVDLDDRGAAVGTTMVWDESARGVSVSPGRMTRLPTLGGRSSFAVAAGPPGVVGGTAQVRGQERGGLPVVWLHGLPVPLGSRLPGVETDGGTVRAIDDRGRMVGEVSVVTGPRPGQRESRAVLWDVVPRG